MDILCVGPKPVRQRYSGVIRVQDVRATEIDKVQVQASFRPGDVVRAEVLSLGDARSYHLTTAKNQLGVVYAKSVAGGCAAAPCLPACAGGQPTRAAPLNLGLPAGPASPSGGCNARRPPPLPSPAGVPMVPISWQEMQCPHTRAVENRKVAKLDA